MITSAVKLPRLSNLLIMCYRLPFVVAVTIGVILSNTHSFSAFRYRGRKGNANGDVFNVLLGLYKLNPLRGSQVYKEFSDHVLLGHGDKHRIVMNFDSNESIKEEVKTNLNEIAKMLHVTSKKPVKKLFQKPEYDIDDVDVENFGVDIILNNLSKEQIKRHMDENIENYSGMFEHLGSNEITNEVPVTKLLPVNTVIRPQISNQNEEAFKHKKEILNSLNNIGPLVEVRNYIQDEGVMNKKFDAIADVIVL